MTRKRIATLGLAVLAGVLAGCVPAAPPPAPPDPPAPVLTATLPWEGHAVQEPTVMLIDGTYRMWYRAAGWEDQPGCTMGTATSPDGVSWTKLDHPVLGGGAGGEAGQTCFLSVDLIGATFYAFYDAGDTNLHYATSADGITWAAQGVALPSGGEDVVIANTAVWVEGNQWKMLYEALNPDGRWRLSLATGTGPNQWVKNAGPLTDLAANPLSTYGGPELQPVDGGYFLYLHRSTTNTNLPTDIYRSFSTDLEHWSPPVLVLAHAGGWQYDQVADPTVVGNMMWYDGDDNSHASAAIGMARLS